ncbi:MAG: SUMF1/EgtB/PvdO family nonheme iron enzyme [SAR324 cluster bacterium]|nr:SUMF1/EgtB/PvdO family nonheme iron enzyme [SAR324 cluster bacterium]
MCRFAGWRLKNSAFCSEKKDNFSVRGFVQRGSNRVNRGGSWNNNARNCRSANRNNNSPDNRNNNNGFRLALSPARQVGGCRLADQRTESSPRVFTFAGQKEAALPVLVAGLDDPVEGSRRFFLNQAQPVNEAGGKDSLFSKSSGVLKIFLNLESHMTFML